ncbi:hypothetical protein DBV15_12304, partial [Temnothorax longispinosus]
MKNFLATDVGGKSLTRVVLHGTSEVENTSSLQASPNANHVNQRVSVQNASGRKRQVKLLREADVRILKEWFWNHKFNAYPSKADKEALRLQTRLSLFKKVPCYNRHHATRRTSPPDDDEGNISSEAENTFPRASLNANHLSQRVSVQNVSGRKRRGKLPRKVVMILKKWLWNHKFNAYPSEAEKETLRLQTRLSLFKLWNHKFNAYPSEAEKETLRLQTRLSLLQVCNCFINTIAFNAMTPRYIFFADYLEQSARCYNRRLATRRTSPPDDDEGNISSETENTYPRASLNANHVSQRVSVQNASGRKRRGKLLRKVRSRERGFTFANAPVIPSSVQLVYKRQATHSSILEDAVKILIYHIQYRVATLAVPIGMVAEHFLNRLRVTHGSAQYNISRGLVDASASAQP